MAIPGITDNGVINTVRITQLAAVAVAVANTLAVPRYPEIMTINLNEDWGTPACGVSVCADIWRKRAPPRYLASVSALQVLNKYI